MEKTRIGFIGAGGIAGRHAGDLLGFEDVQIVAACDPEIGRAEELAQRAGGAAYGDHETMLTREKLDALYICLPPFAHGAPELAAVDAGLPFFVEKPLTTDLPTAERIAQGVAERGLVTAVGYHWRYLDIVEEAQQLLAQNPARLALGYWIDGTPPPAWWRVQARSGGQMMEQTTHIFDLARLLVGEVERVSASGATTERPAFPDADIQDVTSAMLQFQSGAVGTVASTCLLKWPHRVGLHLFCEGMAIELTEHELMVDTGNGRPVRAALGDPFVREDRDFIDAVQGKENRIRAPYAEALRTHRLTVAATVSARDGRWISPAAEALHV